MRKDLGFAAIHLAFVTPGMALLYALGLVQRVRQLPLALGPAYFCGVAALLPVLILLLVVGASIGLPAVVATSLLLSAACVAFAMVAARRGRRPAHPEPRTAAPPVERWLGRIGVTALGLYFAFGARSFEKLPTLGDDWQMWSYKALGLYHYGDLQPEIFAGAAPGPAHPDYPILKPLFDSIFYRAMDGPDLQQMHVFLWILFGSFVWTVAYLLVRRGFALVLVLPPLAALALTLGSPDVIQTGYLDVAVAAFTAAGALCAAMWLEQGRLSWGVLAGVMLAAAANTKNEGLIAAVLILAISAALLRVTRARRWSQWLVVMAIVAAGSLPWQIWRAAHGFGNSDVPASNTVDPGFLLGRTDRLRHAVGTTLKELAHQGRWNWLVPCFLVVAIACIVRDEARREAAFYLATASLMLVSLWLVYWAGSLPILEWLFFSANRVIAGVVFVCGMGLMHLAGLLIPWRPEAAEAEAPP